MFVHFHLLSLCRVTGIRVSSFACRPFASPQRATMADGLVAGWYAGGVEPPLVLQRSRARAAPVMHTEARARWGVVTTLGITVNEDHTKDGAAAGAGVQSRPNTNRCRVGRSHSVVLEPTLLSAALPHTVCITIC